MTEDEIQVYQSEIAFSLPLHATNEQVDSIFERMSTQYSDVSAVYAGICNPPLITLKFSDVPTDDQIKRIRSHIVALWQF